MLEATQAILTNSISPIDDTYDHDNMYENIEDNYENIEDKVQIYNGSESCPLYTDHHSIPRSNEKTIRHDLEKLNMPSNIINIADAIYQNMDVGTKRGKRRKMLLFFCAFTAYNQENIPVDPIWLANICGLERSSISKSLSMCSPVYTNCESPMVRFNPKDYIPVYYKKLSAWITFPEGTIEDIYDMSDEIMEKDSSLNDEKPQTVAAAILVFYMKMHGYTIDKDNYNTIFKRSDMTINKIKKKIIKAYNE